MRSAFAAILCAMLVQAPEAGAAADADPPPGDRVVCVSKQINEFIFAIGAQGHLVARDLTSIYPPEIQKLTSVGYHRALSAEGIASMRPSVLLNDGNLGPNEVVDRLRSVGVPIVTMDPGKSLEGAEDLMTKLGAYFGREREAAAVLAKWKAGMEETIAAAGTWNGQKKLKVMFIHFGQIGNSYLGLPNQGPAEQILQWAGGENALGGNGRMTRLTPELIAAAAPEVIIATDVGFDRYGSPEKFTEMPGINLTPAGRNLRIYRIDETEIMYFGPRTPGSVAKIARWLHGE
jgi:iron complex transport system substrate-binding protein